MRTVLCVLHPRVYGSQGQGLSDYNQYGAMAALRYACETIPSPSPSPTSSPSPSASCMPGAATGNGCPNSCWHKYIDVSGMLCTCVHEGRHAWFMVATCMRWEKGVRPMCVFVRGE